MTGDTNETDDIFVRDIDTSPADATAPTSTASPSVQPNANGWNNTDFAVTLSASDGPDGSGVRQLTYSTVAGQPITVIGDTAQVTVSGQGVTTLSYFATDHAGNIEEEQSLTVRIDMTAPQVDCGTADGLWHDQDVSIACTATDTGSGLADLADADFGLTTSVPDGTADTDAATGSRTVADRAGNTTTAGPIGGNQVDKNPPPAPSTPDLDTAGDTGLSGSDNTTSDTTPSFTGTSEDGVTVRVLVDGVEHGSGVATGGSYAVTTGASPAPLREALNELLGQAHSRSEAALRLPNDCDVAQGEQPGCQQQESPWVHVVEIPPPTAWKHGPPNLGRAAQE